MEAPKVVSMRGEGYVRRDGDVRIDRRTMFGNPFEIGNDGDRTEVIEKFRVLLRETPSLLYALQVLEPKRLVCWCAPLPCHGDVYAEALAAEATVRGA